MKNDAEDEVVLTQGLPLKILNFSPSEPISGLRLPNLT